MPFPSGTYINQIQDYAVRAELETLYSLFQGYLATEHKDSGAHAAVTADSLSTIGNVTADSDGRLPVVIGPFGTGISAGGLGDAGLNIGGKWHLRAKVSSAPGTGQDYELELWDLTNDAIDAALRVVYDGTVWRLMNGGSTKDFALGTSSRRVSSIDVLTATVVTECNSTNGYKEFARSVASGVWQAYTPTWGGSTSNGTIGNGALSGRYAISGNTVHFEVALTIGSTSTLAVGSWSFSLPVGKRNDAFVNIGTSGSWFGGRSGVNFYMSHVFYDTAKAYPILANNPLGQVSNVSPIAWTTGDVMTLGGSYEMA
jgi:hypothetical protein